MPYREIFVDSEHVEGIHTRSGPVARGGLRFSDRSEDYRTEVLGLMKTQTVKNSPTVNAELALLCGRTAALNR
ncbi:MULTISPECIES: NAD-glutamate dehydrogenase domain-containing protein [unclassified Mycolicibacterium]|uniref:NAD-glutamate dehydrogenase domain-containing protein n=1 Tax=unclassified Mycolicibacterium TaxID=2636767 RepID=UPI001390B90C